MPETYEEAAWVGTRWMVAKKNFAHVLMLEAGWPPAYARAAQSDGSACVLTFRSAQPSVTVPRFARAPFFLPPWFPNIVGMHIEEATDWSDVSELLTASYRVLAPKRLVELIDGA